ncbi:hypothetical protein MRX96_047406 [Rhipicephalus microplus]
MGETSAFHGVHESCWQCILRGPLDGNKCCLTSGAHLPLHCSQCWSAPRAATSTQALSLHDLPSRPLAHRCCSTHLASSCHRTALFQYKEDAIKERHRLSTVSATHADSAFRVIHSMKASVVRLVVLTCCFTVANAGVLLKLHCCSSFSTP